MKTIIVGNSGSGKTWLAAELAKGRDIPVIHLDELFWEPGGFDKKRPEEAVRLLVERSKAADSWIVEGVFGELAGLYMDQADLFVWLDLDWPLCRERLLARGSESKKHMSREQSEEGLKKLVDWASRYYERTDQRSHDGHEQMFTNFRGHKLHVRAKDQLAALLSSRERA